MTATDRPRCAKNAWCGLDPDHPDSCGLLRPEQLSAVPRRNRH